MKLFLIAQTLLVCSVLAFSSSSGLLAFQPYSIRCPVNPTFLSTQLQALEDSNADIWAINKESVHVYIDHNLKDVLQSLGLKSKDECEVIFDDVHTLLKRSGGHRLEKRDEASFFDDFQSYKNIIGQLESWTETYPNLVTMSTIGQSVERRNISCIGLTNNTIPSSSKRSMFWLGTMHAREWASPATVMYLVSSILNAIVNGDALVTDWLVNVEIFACPVVNPDGYNL
jgi:murein tripeptide amidase MpaA